MDMLQEVAGKYKKFVVDNHALIATIENGIRLLSYIAPGSQEKSAVISELLFSTAGLVTFLNDSILRKAAKLPFRVSVPQKDLCTFLSVLETVEVFLEIAAGSLWGDYYKWILIICVHIAKAAVKLVLLLRYDSGIQTTPVIPPLKRDSQLAKRLQGQGGISLEQEESLPDNEGASVEPGSECSTFRLTSSGRRVRKLESSPPLNERTWKLPAEGSGKEEKQGSATARPTQLTSKQLLGEGIHISRPLLHLLSMYVCGQKSWKPWFLAGGVDTASLCLLGDSAKLNVVEKAETRRRTVLMLLYLLRSPFYEGYSRSQVIAILKALTQIPGAQLIIRPLLEYLPWWQRVYFYVWTS